MLMILNKANARNVFWSTSYELFFSLRACLLSYVLTLHTKKIFSIISKSLTEILQKVADATDLTQVSIKAGTHREPNSSL